MTDLTAGITDANNIGCSLALCYIIPSCTGNNKRNVRLYGKRCHCVCATAKEQPAHNVYLIVGDEFTRFRNPNGGLTCCIFANKFDLSSCYGIVDLIQEQFEAKHHVCP